MPVAGNVTLVLAEAASAKTAVPGPLTWLHATDGAAGAPLATAARASESVKSGNATCPVAGLVMSRAGAPSLSISVAVTVTLGRPVEVM